MCTIECDVVYADETPHWLSVHSLGREGGSAREPWIASKGGPFSLENASLQYAEGGLTP
jgi:hypothetical protein